MTTVRSAAVSDPEPAERPIRHRTVAVERAARRPVLRPRQTGEAFNPGQTTEEPAALWRAEVTQARTRPHQGPVGDDGGLPVAAAPPAPELIVLDGVVTRPVRPLDSRPVRAPADPLPADPLPADPLVPVPGPPAAAVPVPADPLVPVPGPPAAAVPVPAGPLVPVPGPPAAAVPAAANQTDVKEARPLVPSHRHRRRPGNRRLLHEQLLVLAIVVIALAATLALLAEQWLQSAPTTGTLVGALLPISQLIGPATLP